MSPEISPLVMGGEREEKLEGETQGFGEKKGKC